jgi:chorismate-pyruvate lyase
VLAAECISRATHGWIDQRYAVRRNDLVRDMSTRRATPELDALLAIFYSDPSTLANFDELQETELPEYAKKLLAHDQHMTVTVEEYHHSPVFVEVIEIHTTPTHYSRKILLRRQSDRSPVLFGLVRLSLVALDPQVRSEIESQQTPLGHILIKHNVLRTVRLLSLWQVTPATELCQHLSLPLSQVCYGRTALIYCDGVPAVELLEIVTPG